MARNRSGATAPAVKGNIVVGTGTDTSAVLAVGANGTTLVADSSEATGLKWATASAGGMTLLSTTSLSGSSVSLTSISQAHTNLLIVGQITSTNDTTIRMQYNSDTTGANYDTYRLLGYGTSAVVFQNPGSGFVFDTNNPSGFATKNYSIINIYRYAAAENHQAYSQSRTGFPGTGVDFRGEYTHHVHSGTSAISSIQIIAVSGTLSGTIYLYGVK